MKCDLIVTVYTGSWFTLILTVKSLTCFDCSRFFIGLFSFRVCVHCIDMKLIQFVSFIMGLLQLSPAVYTCTADQDPCGDLQPFYEMALTAHVFQTLKVPNSLHCLKACNNDVRCQSFNHLMGKDTCELNNRTKEARPDDFVADITKLYIKRPKNRGKYVLQWSACCIVKVYRAQPVPSS